jgi:probable O-glycosylation ligase (exosortase A-associated)
VGGILLVGTWAAFRSRFGALLFYFWFAFFRPQEWVYVDLSVLHLSMLIALLLIIPSVFSGIWPNLTHPLSFGTVLFFCAALLSLFGAAQPDVGWYWLDYLARLALVSLLTVSIVRTRRDLLLTVAVIAGSLGFHTAKAGLASILGGGTRFGDGLAGAWSDNNGYAIAGAMIVFLLIAIGQNIRNRYIRIGFMAAACLTVVTVISTFSREGFLALVAACLTYLLLQRRRLLSALAFGAVLTIGIAVVPTPEGYADRLRTIQTYDEVGDTSALGRLHFWQVAEDMAIDRPFGVGLRNFEAAYDKYDFLDGAFGRRRSVHSSHFQVLAELGFPGAAIWFGLLAYSFWVGLKVRRRALASGLETAEQRFDFTMANALLASQSAFVVGGAFIALALNDLTWITFALFASLDRLSRHPAVKPVEVPTAAVDRLGAWSG